MIVGGEDDEGTMLTVGSLSMISEVALYNCEFPLAMLSELAIWLDELFKMFHGRFLKLRSNRYDIFSPHFIHRTHLWVLLSTLAYQTPWPRFPSKFLPFTVTISSRWARHKHPNVLVGPDTFKSFALLWYRHLGVWSLRHSNLRCQRGGSLIKVSRRHLT